MQHIAEETKAKLSEEQTARQKAEAAVNDIASSLGILKSLGFRWKDKRSVAHHTQKKSGVGQCSSSFCRRLSYLAPSDVSLSTLLQITVKMHALHSCKRNRVKNGNNEKG